MASVRRAVLRLEKRGLLLRLAKGLYANRFGDLTLERVAGLLYPPSYISLETALFMHGVIDQAPHIVTCVTLNKTKTFSTQLGEVAYYRIKPALFFGYTEQDDLPVAEPEKAAADYVYLQRQNGFHPALDEWNWENLDLSRLHALLKHYPKSVGNHIAEFAPD